MSRVLASFAGVLLAAGAAYACGSQDASSFLGEGREPSANADAGALLDAAGSGNVQSSGIILVHAAKVLAFRVCFENATDLQPQPDSKVMPAANVVGVERGTAVRIGSIRPAKAGRIFLFEEEGIRNQLPVFGGDGGSCDFLLKSQGYKNLAIEVGNVEEDLSRGVHLLVVQGCPASAPLRPFTAAECGTDYLPATGNLRIAHVGLATGDISRPGSLAARVVQLSPELERQKQNRNVSVVFGDLTTGPALSAPRVDAVATVPTDFPKPLEYMATDDGIYAKQGFRVELVANGTGGPPTETVLQQSLAKVQELSSPSDVPSEYFATPSTFVLMLLGDPSSKLADGGADPDELSKLHIVAVPVSEESEAPTAGDGGAAKDGGSDTGADGGP